MDYGLYSGGAIETMNHLPLRFPSTTERRKLTVYINSWKGMSVGAVHWYADVAEEDNSYVDHENKKFRQPWGVWEHDHLYGAKHVKSCLTRTEAEQWICEVLKTYSTEDYYVFVNHDDRGQAFEELGFRVDTMYADEKMRMREVVRRGLVARYKQGDI